MQISSDSGDRLTMLDRFGTDPGALRADIYIPKPFRRTARLSSCCMAAPRRQRAIITDWDGPPLPTNAGWRCCFLDRDGPAIPFAGSTGSSRATTIAVVANRSPSGR